MEIEGLTGTATQGKGAAEAPDALGRQAFMELLVAQLKNQDPLDPADSKEFVTQLSQLTGVEKLAAIESGMAQLKGATDGLAATQTSGLIGRQIQYDASSFRMDSLGPGELFFELRHTAEEITITLRDDAGNVVRTLNIGRLDGGPKTVVWDGRDDAGEHVPEGRYHMSVSAKDAKGLGVEVNTQQTGMVTGVSYEHGAAELMLGDTSVSLANVLSVSQPTSTKK